MKRSVSFASCDLYQRRVRKREQGGHHLLNIFASVRLADV